MKIESRGGPTVQFLFTEPELETRLRWYFDRVDDVKVRFSNDVRQAEMPDVLVFPAAELSQVVELAGYGCSHVPRIAYGPATLLKASFGAGCGDFLRDPWDIDELHIRLSRSVTFRRFRVGGQVLEMAPGYLSGPKSSCGISHGEYLVLRLLVGHPDEVVPREVFFYALRRDVSTDSRLVDVYISRLRKKLETAVGSLPDEAGIQSVRGVGYRLISGNAVAASGCE